MRLPLGATMLHKNSRERYGKLKKEFRRLMQNFNVDDLDNFIATANSMRKWMKEDSTLIQEQRDALHGSRSKRVWIGRFVIRLRTAKSTSSRSVMVVLYLRSESQK